MTYGIKTCTALAIAVSVTLSANLSINLSSAQEVELTTTECGCDDASCGLKRIGLRKSSRVACPECACEDCLLEVKPSTEKKTCFKVEEKVICVPAVRMPWHKCNPPTTSKSKTIKVLKKETYECPTCSYKWSVAKTSEPASTADKTATVIEPATTKRKIQPLPPIIRASHSKLRLRKETDFTAPTK